jgi:hypothetical protein
VGVALVVLGNNCATEDFVSDTVISGISLVFSAGAGVLLVTGCTGSAAMELLK